MPAPVVFTEDEPITEVSAKQAVLNKHMRVCIGLPIEDLRLVAAFALRLFPSAAGNGR